MPMCMLVPADEHGRMWGDALRDTIAGLTEEDRDRVFAIVATAGTTNAGVIDDLAGVAEVCARARRVDACRRRLRRGRAGRAQRARSLSTASSTPTASSSIRTSGSSLRSTAARCVYRDPTLARAAHTQHAEYLDVLHGGTDDDPMVTSGTPATSPTTCRAGLAACRSGSAWRPTAPRRIATPSRRRCASRDKAPS